MNARAGSYTVPDTVTRIGNVAFYGCNELSLVTIDDSVSTIGNWAFHDCTRLTEVYFLGDAPAFGNGPFSGTPATLYYLPETTGWEPTVAGRPTGSWRSLLRLEMIELHPGLTLTGKVGAGYSIEYAIDLTENDWRRLEFLQLPASPYLWVDKSAPARGTRFYRAVETEAPTSMVFLAPGQPCAAGEAARGESSRGGERTRSVKGSGACPHEPSQFGQRVGSRTSRDAGGETSVVAPVPSDST